MLNGHHQEFTDSANNGPWGTALINEFIPKTEAYFRAIDASSARFVAGHSSGGWAALWLQITYPDIFAGEWSISPDSIDFRDFLGIDLTASAPQNISDSTWRDAYGETVRGYVNGSDWEQRQIASFNWVFSPGNSKGGPEPLFDLKSGDIDAAVARYWHVHYDISWLIRENWSTLQPRLRGKLHIFVGSKDDFHLNDPVTLFQKQLRDLGSDAEIQIVPGLDHWSIFEADGGLRAYIIGEASVLTASTNPAFSIPTPPRAREAASRWPAS